MVRPEILDELEPADPRAVRSRRDLQRVNVVMGSCAILSRSLRQIARSRSTSGSTRLLELGAGDGSLALKLAQRLTACWPEAQLTLLDRQALLAPAMSFAFARFGWTLRPLIMDALEWARAPAQPPLTAGWDVILANLFLHHFEEERLREVLSAAARRCVAFVACEPRRSRRALVGARLLPVLRMSGETRHDAMVSVQAGFRGRELSRLWPSQPAGWRLEERPAGLFSHLFVAVRGDAST